MSKLDYYQILGVARNASSEEITAVYRQLAKKWHPDKHHGNQEKSGAARNFKVVQNAYENLIDPKKRSRYDEKFRKQEELERKRQELYEMLVQTKSEVTTEEEFFELAKRFRTMGGYKDTAELARQCEARYQSLKANREERKEQEQREKKKEHQRRWAENRELYQVFYWVSGAAIAAVVLIGITIAVMDWGIVPNREVVELLQEQPTELQNPTTPVIPAQAGIQTEDANPVPLPPPELYVSSFPNIFEAAERGTVNDVKYLVSQGTDVNAKRPDGWMPIHVAAHHNPNVDVLEYFVSLGYDVNEKNYDHNELTLLHCAAWMNTNVEVVKYLVSQGADVNAKNGVGWTPLHEAAARNSNLEVLRYLISQRADVHARNNDGRTPLDTANTEEKRAILRAAATPYVSSFSSICEAAKHGTVHDVAYFIRNGADVNGVENEWNFTPLLEAAAHNPSVEILRYLVSQGANVNVKNSAEWTPLHYAAENGNVAALQILVSAGADVHARNNIDWTPLHHAAQNGSAESMTVLIASGADINARAQGHFTPLDTANTDEKRAILRAAGGRSGQ